jgi:hypothetical protein
MYNVCMHECTVGNVQAYRRAGLSLCTVLYNTTIRVCVLYVQYMCIYTVRMVYSISTRVLVLRLVYLLVLYVNSEVEGRLTSATELGLL